MHYNDTSANMAPESVDDSMPSENLALFPPEDTPSEPLFKDLIPGDIHAAKAVMDEFIQQLDTLPYVIPAKSRIHTWARGCPSLLTKISNGNWVTEPAVKTADDQLVVTDPVGCWDVHMEVELKPGLSVLDVLLHYETAPFLTQRKFGSMVDNDAAEQYRRRRKAFIEEFGCQCRIPGIKLTKGWELVAKIEYKYKAKTVTEVSKWLSAMINDVTDAINWTMYKLDARARFVAECEADDALEADSTTRSSAAVVTESEEHDSGEACGTAAAIITPEPHDAPLVDAESAFANVSDLVDAPEAGKVITFAGGGDRSDDDSANGSDETPLPPAA